MRPCSLGILKGDLVRDSARRIIITSIGTLLLIATMLSAEADFKPLGSVSSKGPVVLSGTSLEVAEIPSWPVAMGDVIQTTSDPAIVLFNEGTRLLLAKGSEVRLTQNLGKTAVVVLAGSVMYSVSSRSTLTLIVQNELISARSGASGTISISGMKPQHTLSRDQSAETWNQGRVPRAARPTLSPYEP